jgi:hypothetical protein
MKYSHFVYPPAASRDRPTALTVRMCCMYQSVMSLVSSCEDASDMQSASVEMSGTAVCTGTKDAAGCVVSCQAMATCTCRNM